MNKLIFSFFFSLISLLSYAQNEPKLVVEQTKNSYELSIKMDDVSNVSSVIVYGEITQKSYTNRIMVELEIADLVNNKAFQSLSLESSISEFIVEVTDKNGIKTSYPLIELNIYE